MKLIEKIDQNRRDFRGKYECQSCGNVKTDDGLDSYDDHFFHSEVVPDMKCEKCEKSTNDLNLPNEPMATKYREGEVV